LAGAGTSAEVLRRRFTGVRQWSTLFQAIASFSRRKPLGAVGGAIVVLLILVALLAPVIAPFDPYETHPTFSYASPGGDLFLGGDQVGRDVLSRLIYGTRISLYVGIVSVLIGATVGTLVGITSAYLGGIIDLILQRILDAIMAFPGIILAIAIMAGLGRASLENVIIALVIVLTPGAARTIRSRTLSLKEMDFVLAARAVGASDGRILFRHILPNCFSIYIVFFSITLGFAIVAEASLSFLGVGAPPDAPSWGGMLAQSASKYIEVAPWLAVFPGIAIALVVFGVNMLGDALRDILDPRLRGTG
jgi:peptide/nickel transport system permease protein